MGRAITASGPAITLTLGYARAGALMARQWSARCYGVARHREGSRQNSIGGLRRAFSPAFRAGSLYPLATWVPKNLARRNFGLLVSAGPRLQAARCRGRRRRRR